MGESEECGGDYLWELLAKESCGGIWKEQNSRIFEDKKRLVMMIIDSILCKVGSWLMVNCEFKD